MIISVDKFREFVDTDKTDEQLSSMLSAIEYAIRKTTNNNFQQRNRRSIGTITDGYLTVQSPVFNAGDTIQISGSEYNDGLYYIESIDGDGHIALDSDDLISEDAVIVTKINYPADVQMGVIEMLKWKLKNELQNSGDVSNAPIASENLSRHSVSYQTDSSEYDIDATIGVPKKIVSFLKAYEKARF